MRNTRLLLISVVALRWLDAEGATLRVPADFTTIQAAVNAAQPGDSIVVSAGVYNEKIVITTPGVRLIGPGVGGISAAVVDGAGRTGPGIHVRSSSRSAPLTHVEIRWMTVRDFERGIVLENVAWSRLFANETSRNVDKETSTLDSGDGILLIASSENHVQHNLSHDNGHAGIRLTSASLGNIIQSNQLRDNGTQQPSFGGCNIELSGPSGNNIDNNNGNNTIVQNALHSGHWGICIGPEGANSGNVVARNQVVNHVHAGISIRGRSGRNSVLDNLTGVVTAGFSPSTEVDLHDDSTGLPNLWERNRGKRFVYIPIAGRVSGARGENFVSDLHLANSANAEKEVIVDLFASSIIGRHGPSATRIVKVPPLGQTILNDVFRSLFGGSGTGALRIRIDENIVAVSRVLNDRRPNNDGTNGVLVASAEIDESCFDGILPMLSNAADFRTNLGFYNPLPNPVMVNLAARRNDGSIIGDKSLNVPAFSHSQTAVFTLLDTVSETDLSQPEFFVTYSVTGGPLFVYAAVVDNRTGDGIYLLGSCKLPN